MKGWGKGFKDGQEAMQEGPRDIWQGIQSLSCNGRDQRCAVEDHSGRDVEAEVEEAGARLEAEDQ